MSRTASYQGYEVCLFPLDNVGITADPWSANHVVNGVTNTGIWDNGWHNQANDPLYAPCSMELVADMSDSANTQLWRSVDPVWIPGFSTPQYVSMSFSHSNTKYFTGAGTQIAQGTHFYDTGTAGLGSGPHVHMILFLGSRTSMFPVGLNPNGYGNIWYSPNPPDNIAAFFYVPEDATISSGWGLTWSRWEGQPEMRPKIAILNLLSRRRKKKGGVLYGSDPGLV